MKIHQHVLLQTGFPVIDADAVVMSVEAVDESLYRGFVEMSEIRGRLPRLMTHHQNLRIDEAECIDDDFALD